jgi:hypothetical protein
LPDPTPLATVSFGLPLAPRVPLGIPLEAAEPFDVPHQLLTAAPVSIDPCVSLQT